MGAELNAPRGACAAVFTDSTEQPKPRPSWWRKDQNMRRVTVSRIVVEVSYSQVCVFSTALSEPFNDWTQEHTMQGFSWRPHSVSFRTLDQAGEMSIDILMSNSFNAASSSACRVIRVPFSVPAPGDIEIASIGSAVCTHVVPGDYELTFEHGRSPTGQMWAKLYFHRVDGAVEAKILRADDDLQPSDRLLMSAEPA